MGYFNSMLRDGQRLRARGGGAGGSSGGVIFGYIQDGNSIMDGLYFIDGVF